MVGQEIPRLFREQINERRHAGGECCGNTC
jgi:hypothetical protein